MLRKKRLKYRSLSWQTAGPQVMEILLPQSLKCYITGVSHQARLGFPFYDS